MAVRSKVYVFGRSIAGIVGVNTDDSKNVSLVFAVCCVRVAPSATSWSIGSVCVYFCVIHRLRTWGGLIPFLVIEKEKNLTDIAVRNSLDMNPYLLESG
jgi:hypothetical protein